MWNACWWLRNWTSHRHDLLLRLKTLTDGLLAEGKRKKKKKKKEETIPYRRRETALIEDRVASYQDCKSDHVVASIYAGAGFTYLKDSEAIRCDTCGITLTKFKDWSHDPVCLHQTFRPHCAYLERHQNNESRRYMAQDSKGKMFQNSVYCQGIWWIIVTWPRQGC